MFCILMEAPACLMSTKKIHFLGEVNPIFLVEISKVLKSRLVFSPRECKVLKKISKIFLFCCLIASDKAVFFFFQ